MAFLALSNVYSTQQCVNADTPHKPPKTAWFLPVVVGNAEGLSWRHNVFPALGGFKIVRRGTHDTVRRCNKSFSLREQKGVGALVDGHL